MTDYIVNALTGADLGAYFVTLIVSMIPVIELRGAIPLGVGLGLSHFDAMWVSMLGNMLPVPFIILFIRPIFKWMTRKSEKLGRVVEKLEARAEGKWDKVHKYQFFGLAVFVGIPAGHGGLDRRAHRRRDGHADALRPAQHHPRRGDGRAARHRHHLRFHIHLLSPREGIWRKKRNSSK